MAVRFLDNGGGASASRPFDSDTLSWVNAVGTQGGSVGYQQQVDVDQLVFALKNSGVYPLLDDFSLCLAENQPQAIVSFKKHLVTTLYNAPTFTNGIKQGGGAGTGGFTFDGSTQYGDTGFIMSTMCTAASVTGFHGSVVEGTDVNASATAYGGSNTSTRSMAIIPRVGATIRINVNSNVLTATVSSSIGHSLVQRTSATTAEAYKNGAALSLGSQPTANGSSLLPTSLFIGAVNSSGTPGSFRASNVLFTTIGASLSAGQVAALYTAIKTYCATFGVVLP